VKEKKEDKEWDKMKEWKIETEPWDT